MASIGRMSMKTSAPKACSTVCRRNDQARGDRRRRLAGRCSRRAAPGGRPSRSRLPARLAAEAEPRLCRRERGVALLRTRRVNCDQRPASGRSRSASSGTPNTRSTPAPCHGRLWRRRADRRHRGDAHPRGTRPQYPLIRHESSRLVARRTGRLPYEESPRLAPGAVARACSLPADLEAGSTTRAAANGAASTVAVGDHLHPQCIPVLEVRRVGGLA
jgi:hypothetical protein